MSGNNITISYTVKNIGEQSTGSTSWNDYIWLSSDEDLRQADDQLIKVVPNLSYLDTGQSYTNTITVQLPQNVLSTQLLFVSTDNNDAYCATPGWVCYSRDSRKSHFSGMSELNEENNFAFDTLAITPSPAPDLMITALGAPSSAFSGDEITLTTTLLNNGNAAAEISDVTYCYYLSPDSLPSANAQQLFPSNSNRTMVARSIGSSGSGGGGSSKSVSVVQIPPPPEYLSPDSVKMRSKKLSLPQSIFGKYYLHTYIDCGDDIFEAFGEGNNIYSSTPINITLTPPPDLQVSNISGPDTASSGDKVLIDWNTVNQGATNPVYRWRDSIFLCSSPVFNNDSVIASGRRYFYNPSNTNTGGVGGSGLSFSISIAPPYELEIPNGISGHYYVFVKADAEEDVYEYNYEANNWGRKDTSIYINFSPYPDMQVTNMSIPATDTGYTDTLYNLQWTVKNLGTGANQQAWRDEVYISSSANPNASGKKYLGGFNHQNTLAAGDSAVRSINFKMPNEPAGTYYFHVITEVDDDLYEYNFENNNSRSSSFQDPDGFYLKPRPAAPPAPGLY
ncbi:MAG: CARDB domain-containing protein [Owenweeksia sp.]|nr:CARDB domain-containing protein [Owenweeksia sp.]